jgi:hypothetical protein
MVSINNGRDVAHGDMRSRMKDLERGGAPACPECHLVWVQGIDGEYRLTKKISR